MSGGRVKVVLRTSGAQAYKIDEGSFELDSKHRLPVRQIEQQFNVAKLVWAEGGEALDAAPDGFSTIAFELYVGKSLDIQCTPIGPRNEKPVPAAAPTPVFVLKSNEPFVVDHDPKASLAAQHEEERLAKSLNKKKSTGPTAIFNAPPVKPVAVAAAAAKAKAPAELPAWKQKRLADEEAHKAAQAAQAAAQAHRAPVVHTPPATTTTTTAHTAPAPAAARPEAAPVDERLRKQQADLAAAEEARLERSFAKGAEQRRSATLKGKKPVPVAAASTPAPAATPAPTPAAAPAKAVQPTNAHGESATATAIHSAAAVLYGGAHGSGNIGPQLAKAKEAAESLEWDAFVAALGEAFRAAAGETQLAKLRLAVEPAQQLAINGALFGTDPDNEAAMAAYSAANEKFCSLADAAASTTN